ncbi:MAG: DUF4349 domain-containing protein [Nocardioidaceae bacterium]
MRTTRARAGAALVAAALMTITITACGGGGSDDMGTTSAADAGSVERDSSTTDSTAADAPAAQSKAQPADLTSDDVIRTGTIELVAEDLAKKRDQLETDLRRFGGNIARQSTVNDKHGDATRGNFVVRVPASAFDEFMQVYKDDPSVTSSDIQTEDVHTKVIDVQSRLSTLRISRERLSSYMGKAANVRALLDYEKRITQVDSEIARLTRQRDYLADQTSFATVTISMRTPKTAPAHTGKLDDAGFVSGLEHGWDAFVAACIVALTVLGAALPFLIVAAVVGVPLWLWLRSRRNQEATGA